MTVRVRLSDSAGMEMLKALREHRHVILSAVIIASDDDEDLVATVRLARATGGHGPHLHDESTAGDGFSPLTAEAEIAGQHTEELEAYAAARWARAVVPVIDCPRDPRTLAGWARWIAASPGAVRNWCRTAGVGSRRSLVFARLLRAVVLAEGGRHRPENVLDVVDRRTLCALLNLAGLSGDGEFPRDIAEFVARQTLVRDPDVLLELTRACDEQRRGKLRRAAAAAPRRAEAAASAKIRKS